MSTAKLEGKSSLQGPTQRKERTDSLRLSSDLYTHVIVAHASICKQRGEGIHRNEMEILKYITNWELEGETS